jgi:hypothetical protein
VTALRSAALRNARADVPNSERSEYSVSTPTEPEVPEDDGGTLEENGSDEEAGTDEEAGSEGDLGAQ